MWRESQANHEASRDKTGNVNEDAKWEETMLFRRIFDTRDAAVKSKGKPTNGIYMGENYFSQALQGRVNERYRNIP